jgi:hypothetical protein
MTFLLLYLLACFDGAFSGFRAAAGHNALICKRAYFLRAMGRGLLWAQVAVIIAAALGIVLLLMAAASTDLLDAFEAAGRCLLQVYLPYATLIGLAFALRAIPNVDVRSLTSVLVFGPFTMIRPLVAVAGVLWALLNLPRMEIGLLGAVVLPMMLSMEWFLGRRYPVVDR